MALTDAQAKIIAANKKKKNKGNSFVDDFESKKQKRPSSSSLPVVTPTKTVKNEVTTPLKEEKPSSKKTTYTKVSPILADMVGSYGLRNKMTDNFGRLYTPLDILRDRASIGDNAQTLAYLARVRGEGTRKERYESWQEALQKAAEERVKRQEKLKAYTLSEQDSGLPLSRRQMIQEAKDAWQKAKESGDLEGMHRAHEKAETVRGWAGYSGGVTGNEYITAELTEADRRKLTEAGQNRLKKALVDRQKAIEDGDIQAQMKASEKIVAIRNDPASLRQPTVGKESLDAHGRTVERDIMTAEEARDFERRFQEGLYSTMAAVPGSLLSFLETTNQAIDNDVVERNRAYLQDKANRLYEYQVKLEMVRNGEGVPSWGSESWLEQQVRIAENAQRLLSQGTNVDPNLPGQTLMRKSGEAAVQALDGVEGWRRDLAQAAMAVGQNLPSVALSLIPGVGPALGAGLMGLQAAGGRAWELNEQNAQAEYASMLLGGPAENYGAVDPAHSSFRSLLSGIVEAGTGLIPLGRLANILKGKSGNGFLRNILEQMAMEGTEEGVSYMANFLLDKAAQDPNAEWTPEELWQNVKLGAIAGGMMAGGGSVVGSMINRAPASYASLENAQATPAATQEEETDRILRQTAEAMLTETAQETAGEPVAASVPKAATVAKEQGKVQQKRTREAPTAVAGSATTEPVKSREKKVKLRRIEPIPVPVETIQTKRITEPVVSPTFLYEVGKTLGQSGQKSMKAAWDGRGNQAQYAADFIRVYNQALTGSARDSLQASASMTEAQIFAAYNAGITDRQTNLTEAKRAAEFAVLAGEDSGLVYDDYVKAEMDTTVAKEINTVAKQLGLRVQMVDSVAGGSSNAEIQGSMVSIEKGNPNPVRTLFGHEMTHRVQELAPESYREFRDYVMSSQKAQEKVQERIQAYAARNVNLSQEAAMDEIVADYAGDLIESKDLMKRFIDQNRKNQPLLGRMLTALKDMAAKLTGKYKTHVNDAVALLEKAVNEAAVQAKKLGKNKNTAQTDGVNRYSMKDEVLALDGVDWMDNYSSIKDQLRKHADEINAMDPVAVVDYAPKSAPHLVSTMMEEVAKLGGKSMKNNGVRFSFDEAGAKSINGHAKSHELRAAALASPYVAKYGKLIAGQKNHENTGLTTLTYAAPVVINDTAVNVGLAIQFQENGRPRAVNVGLQSGGVFKVDTKKAPKGLDSRVSQYGRGTSLPTMSASKSTVARGGEDVKFSLKGVDGNQNLVEEFDDIPKRRTKARRPKTVEEQALVDDMYYGRKAEEQRGRREKDLAKVKAKYKEKDAAGRERRKARELRAKILRHTKNLSKKLLRPNDNQHIPEKLRSAVANLLNSINLESSFELAYGKDAMYHRVNPGEVMGADATKRTKAFQELRLAYEKILSEADQQMVIDPDLMTNIQEMEALKDTPIGGLSVSQLTTMWNTIKAVEASITSYNKMFGQQRFETIREVAEGLKADNAGKRDRGDYRGPIGAMDKLINAGMLTPESFFHRMGKTGESLFRMLRNAQDKHIGIMQEAQKYTEMVVKDVDVRKLEKETHTFDVEGQRVTMTTAQIMSLYELMKRQQAVDHVVEGGIRMEAVSRGLKKKGMSEAIRVSPEKVGEILEVLTPKQIEIADGLQKFMGDRLSQLGNEASMEVYGYEKFKEQNYFPIKVDSNQTITDQAKDAVSATIAGRGFTKGTKPHANNALMVRNIFDVYADHVTDMATYSAWLAPMENLQRVFNFKFRDENGNLTGTVKGLIHRIYGQNGEAYWKKLTEDLNNGVKGVNDNPFQALIGNYKASAIGANLRVFIQQPTSILRALDSISPADFMVGLTKANPNTWKKVKEYAPIAVWKDWGYFDADTGRQMKSILFGDDSRTAKVNNALMAPAGAMDSLAWSHIWNALEVETARKHKNLQKGSDAFYKKVAERFNEVVDHTQVVDGILQRSQVMRSPDGVTKMATSFMAEPTKIFNMFTTAAYDLRKSQDKDFRKKARKTMARTSVALFMSFVANAAAQSLVDAFRDDDKDEEYWEKFFQAFVGLEGDEETKMDKAKSLASGNMGKALNPFGYLPFVKDIVSLIEGYDVARMDMESISNVVSAAGYCIKSLNGEGKMTQANALLNLAAELSRFLGTPVANIKRDVLAGINTWLNLTDNYKGQYDVAKVLYDINYTGNKGMFLDIAYLAWRDGDEETFIQISQDLMDAFLDKVNGETIESAMKSRTKKQMEEDMGYQPGQTLEDLIGILPEYAEEEEKEDEFSAKNLNAEEYNRFMEQRADSYRKYEDAVTSSSVWGELDDKAKDKVIGQLWKYAAQTALEDVSGGKFVMDESSMVKAKKLEEDHQVDPGVFFTLYGMTGVLESDKTVDGETISDSLGYKKLMAVRESGLLDGYTDEQQDAVYGALDIGAKIQSMSEDSLSKLAAEIEAEKNAPSFFVDFPEEKKDDVKGLLETLGSFQSDYDGNGKTIKGRGKQDKIKAELYAHYNSGEYTAHQCYLLFHEFYTSDKNNPWAYAKNG